MRSALPDVFQFHYGAIQTLSTQSQLNLFTFVSIPLWCDSNADLGQDPAKRLTVSIPLWCDSNAYLGQDPANSLTVSIPLWCDSNSQFLPLISLLTSVSIPLWCDSNLDIHSSA